MTKQASLEFVITITSLSTAGHDDDVVVGVGDVRKEREDARFRISQFYSILFQHYCH